MSRLFSILTYRHYRILVSTASRAKWNGYGDEEDDSDAISVESFESELSLTERRLHQSAIVSCDDMVDELVSRDEENSVRKSEISFGRSC